MRRSFQKSSSDATVESNGWYEHNRCRWQGPGGARCQMLGTSALSGGNDARYYCLWHFQALKDPEYVADYNQFLGWREALLESYPNSLWAGNPKQLWMKLQDTQGYSPETGL